MSDFFPKQEFSKGPHAAAWVDISASKTFKEAVTAALCQMQFNQGYSKDHGSAAANGLQMEGARAFLSILMNLTTPPEEPVKRTMKDNLIHA